MKGRVKIYYDVSEGFGDPNLHPFNLYVEGSYFGDSDILVNEGKDGRDGTAMADLVSHLLVLVRKEFIVLLEKHETVAVEMKEVAEARKKHHIKSIEEIKKKHGSEVDIRKGKSSQKSNLFNRKALSNQRKGKFGGVKNMVTVNTE